MKTLGYYNGTVDELDKLQIPMLDRACYFGDGVYDGTMARNGKILYLEEHMRRFFNSAKAMRFDIPYSKEQWSHILYEQLEKMDDSDQFVYWQITRGTELRHHTFPTSAPNMWIMITPEGFEDLSQPVDVITCEDTRYAHCDVKTLNLLPNVMAAQRTIEAHCYESIFVRDGVVTECAHSNVHILKDGVLITHPADNHILPGIARAHLIAMCARLGIPVDERPYPLDELMAADEVIITSSSAFAMGVAHVDGNKVGGADAPRLHLLQERLTQEAIEATS